MFVLLKICYFENYEYSEMPKSRYMGSVYKCFICSSFIQKLYIRSRALNLFLSKIKNVAEL